MYDPSAADRLHAAYSRYFGTSMQAVETSGDLAVLVGGELTFLMSQIMSVAQSYVASLITADVNDEANADRMTSFRVDIKYALSKIDPIDAGAGQLVDTVKVAILDAAVRNFPEVKKLADDMRAEPLFEPALAHKSNIIIMPGSALAQ